MNFTKMMKDGILQSIRVERDDGFIGYVPVNSENIDYECTNEYNCKPCYNCWVQDGNIPAEEELP